MDDLRSSLSIVLERNALAIPLEERQYGLRVARVPDRQLFRTANFILAASAKVAAESLRQRFPSQVKIGPVEKIRDLVNLQLPGILIQALPVVPRQIPHHTGFSYFELDRGTSCGSNWTLPEAWPSTSRATFRSSRSSCGPIRG